MDPTSCAHVVGCLCANCVKPLTVDGHPVMRQPEIAPLNPGTFSMALAAADGHGWRRAGNGKVNRAWGIEQALRTIQDSSKG